MSSKHPETLALHAGWRRDSATNAVAVPIYQTTSYQFDSTEHAANLFGLKQLGNVYTRIMNPTNDVLEQRLAAIEGGVAALALGSGQAASAFSVQNLARAGDNFVCSTDLYGGTWNLFANTLKDQGIEVRFVDPNDPFHRSPSVMTYDRDVNQIVTQDSRAWIAGLGDEGGCACQLPLRRDGARHLSDDARLAAARGDGPREGRYHHSELRRELQDHAHAGRR